MMTMKIGEAEESVRDDAVDLLGGGHALGRLLHRVIDNTGDLVVAGRDYDRLCVIVKLGLKRIADSIDRFLSASVSLSWEIVRSSPSSTLMANQRAVAEETREPRTSMIFASASRSRRRSGSAARRERPSCRARSRSSQARPCRGP